METKTVQDVITLLKKDHADVKKLFKRFEKSESTKEKNALATEICGMLRVHARVEEEIVYPAARDVFDDEDEELVNEAAVEHGTAKDLIGQIEAMNASDEMFDATVKVLGEYINHHVEEEETEMFPRLKISDLDLKELGMHVARRKEQLMRSEKSDEETSRSPVRIDKIPSQRAKVSAHH